MNDGSTGSLEDAQRAAPEFKALAKLCAAKGLSLRTGGFDGGYRLVRPRHASTGGAEVLPVRGTLDAIRKYLKWGL